MGRKLSQEQCDRIIKLFHEGLASGEVAKIMDITPHLLWKTCQYLGLVFKRKPQSKLTQEQLNKIKELAAQNVQVSKVAEIIGTSKSVVLRAYGRLDLIPFKRGQLFFTPEQNAQIIQLFNENKGTRAIAKIMGVKRNAIKKAFKVLNLDSSGRKYPRSVYLLTEKTCKTCGITKPIDQFRRRQKGDRISCEPYCFGCEAHKNNEYAKKCAKIARQTDPNYVIKHSVSYFIWRGLKNNDSSKNGHSCLKYLPYTIGDLRLYLESQFEPWMSWDNHGIYNRKTWDDSDSSTWTWQIDHIIPQSKLPYTSMTDDNFKKCWALSNLRPLNSKLNNLEGVRRIRH